MNALIYMPTKTAMQSGVGKTKKWCLKLNREDDRFIDPIMGWTGSTNMEATEVKLSFATKEEAIQYAKSKGMEYEVIEPKKTKKIVKFYADNFKFCPAEEEKLK